MKLEVAESLFYSWLRHVKGCHVVQTNWKPSPTWTLNNEDKIEKLQRVFVEHYAQDGNIFGKTKNHSQLLKQAEVDVLGLSLSDDTPNVYAIDAAFHSGGLGYTKSGNRDNVARVIKKILRTAVGIYGFFDTSEGEIIFASPKINPADWQELEPYENKIGELFKDNGLNFTVKIIANERFLKEILEPVKAVAKTVKDTSELFLRTFQLLKTCEKFS